MAAIMNRAVNIDEQHADEERLLVEKLEHENRLMRQLLQIEEGDGDAGSSVSDLCRITSSPETLSGVSVETQTLEDDESADSDDTIPSHADQSSASPNLPGEGFLVTTELHVACVEDSASQTSESSPVSEEFISTIVRRPRQSVVDQEDSTQSTGSSEVDVDADTAGDATPSAVGQESSSPAPASAKKPKHSSPKKWAKDNCNCSNNSDLETYADGTQEFLLESDASADLECQGVKPNCDISENVHIASAGDISLPSDCGDGSMMGNTCPEHDSLKSPS